MHKVNMQVVSLPVPAQDGITRDNVTVRVDAVVYFRVIDPVQVMGVADYRFAMLQVAQAGLRRTIAGEQPRRAAVASRARFLDESSKRDASARDAEVATERGTTAAEPGAPSG